MSHNIAGVLTNPPVQNVSTATDSSPVITKNISIVDSAIPPAAKNIANNFSFQDPNHPQKKEENYHSRLLNPEKVDKHYFNNDLWSGSEPLILKHPNAIGPVISSLKENDSYQVLNRVSVTWDPSRGLLPLRHPLVPSPTESYTTTRRIDVKSIQDRGYKVLFGEYSRGDFGLEYSANKIFKHWTKLDIPRDIITAGSAASIGGYSGNITSFRVKHVEGATHLVTSLALEARSYKNPTAVRATLNLPQGTRLIESGTVSGVLTKSLTWGGVGYGGAIGYEGMVIKDTNNISSKIHTNSGKLYYLESQSAEVKHSARVRYKQFWAKENWNSDVLSSEFIKLYSTTEDGDKGSFESAILTFSNSDIDTDTQVDNYTSPKNHIHITFSPKHIEPPKKRELSSDDFFEAALTYPFKPSTIKSNWRVNLLDMPTPVYEELVAAVSVKDASGVHLHKTREYLDNEYGSESYSIGIQQKEDVTKGAVTQYTPFLRDIGVGSFAASDYTGDSLHKSLSSTYFDIKVSENAPSYSEMKKILPRLN